MTTSATTSNWEGRFPLRSGYGLFIDGAERASRAGEEREVTSPRDGRPITRIAWAGPDDVDDAVAAARRALAGSWSTTPARERSDLLLALADRIEQERDELAYLEAVDNGKTIAAMTGTDMAVGIDSVRYFAAAARTLEGRAAVMPDADVLHHELLEPVGVVAELLPWNGPIWTGLQRLSAILAAGSAAVLKPSEVAGAPVLLRVCEIARDIGIPAGVVNLVNGDGAVGEALVRHPDVALVSLTGGTATGARVLAAAAPSIKRVSLELGGKNPNVVFADGDLEQAVMWSAIGGFSNSGQICVSGSRVLVEASIADEFAARLVEHAERLSVGDPLVAETEMGPVVSESHAEQVWGSIERAANEGAIATGGRRYQDGRDYVTYVPPTVVTDLAADADVATCEIFGPVVAVVPFRDEAQAIEIANASTYGLASGVFTRDIDRAWRVSRALKAGEVFVNRWFTPGVVEAPSEGYKQSGVGGVGLRKYLQRKNLFFQVRAGG